MSIYRVVSIYVHIWGSVYICPYIWEYLYMSISEAHRRAFGMQVLAPSFFSPFFFLFLFFRLTQSFWDAGTCALFFSVFFFSFLSFFFFFSLGLSQSFWDAGACALFFPFFFLFPRSCNQGLNHFLCLSLPRCLRLSCLNPKPRTLNPKP